MATAAGSLDADAHPSDIEETTIQLSTTVKKHGGAVWQALTSPDGSAILLGQGAVLGGKGESWHSDDGTMGVVRSFHPIEQLRLSWHETPSADSTLIEIDLTPLGDGTLLRMWHENVPTGNADERRHQWEDRLEALAEYIDA